MDSVKWSNDMSLAPKDGTPVLVWYDHDADPYQDPENQKKLTDYAANAEGGDFLSGYGFCVAAWYPQHWVSEDEFGSGYWLPAVWVVYNNDCGTVCNPTHWAKIEAPE